MFYTDYRKTVDSIVYIPIDASTNLLTAAKNLQHFYKIFTRLFAILDGERRATCFQFEDGTG